MPAKKTRLSDAERAKRIRETAREAETSDDPKDFERAFEKVVGNAPSPSKPQVKNL